MCQTVMELNKNKATSGNIPTKSLKKIARDTCVPLTDCMNSAILNGVFPDELKEGDVTHLYKNNDLVIKYITDQSAPYHYEPKSMKKCYINN